MNIVLIVSDTFRYDFLGINNNIWIDTRDLDAFGKKCTIFDSCYIGSFPTIPHRTDMTTGRFIFPHDGWCPLKENWIPVAEYLQEAGYATQLICDTPHLLKRGYNFHRGFDGYFWIRGQELDIAFTRMNYPIETIMPHNKTRADYKLRGKLSEHWLTSLNYPHRTDYELREKPKRSYAIPFETTLLDIYKWENRHWIYEEDRFMVQTAQHAIRWLEDNYKAENFFLWIDFFDVHEPWDPPEYIVKKYDPDYKGIPMLDPNYGPADIYTKAELKNLKAHYSGEVTLISKWIGQILRKIEEVSLMDKTAIIFTSDHGMYLGEHNRTGKGNICPEDKRGKWPLYREITHIPLMIYVPGVKPKRVNNLVQPVDIMPTILELARQKAPDRIDGKSLCDLIKGKKSDPRKYVVCAYGYIKDSNVVSIQDKEYALVIGGYDADVVELFDIKQDPGQTKNVIDKYPLRVKKLYKNLTELFTNKEIDMEALLRKIEAFT